MNISLCYVNLEDVVNARKYLNEATLLCGGKCSDDVMTHIMYASGCIYLELKDYESAEMEFVRSYESAAKLHDTRMKLDNIVMLADLCQRRNQIDRAFSYLNEAEKQISDGVPYNLEVIKIYSKIAELYLMKRAFENAAAYQARYIKLKDSIYDESLTTSLIKVETDYLEKGHRAEVAAQKEILLLKEEVIGHQRTLNVVTGLLAFLVLISAIFIYRNYLQKSSLTRLLDQRVKERTSELESSYRDMVSVLRESDIVNTRLTPEVIQSVGTIRGLCGIGKADVKDETPHSYFTKIDHIASRLSQQMESVYAPS